MWQRSAQLAGLELGSRKPGSIPYSEVREDGEMEGAAGLLRRKPSEFNLGGSGDSSPPQCGGLLLESTQARSDLIPGTRPMDIIVTW